MKWKFCLAALLLTAVTGCRSTSRLEVVSGFELERYLGTWYEAARLPHGFEKNLSSVSAEYSPDSKGRIKVLNKGYNDVHGEWETIEGTAKFRNTKEQGWLKVSFFKPFYASYKIIHLDENYTEAIVTGPTYGYLWILSRTPSMEQADLERLIARAGAFGFDTDKLIIVDQSKNQS